MKIGRATAGTTRGAGIHERGIRVNRAGKLCAGIIGGRRLRGIDRPHDIGRTRHWKRRSIRRIVGPIGQAVRAGWARACLEQNVVLEIRRRQVAVLDHDGSKAVTTAEARILDAAGVVATIVVKVLRACTWCSGTGLMVAVNAGKIPATLCRGWPFSYVIDNVIVDKDSATQRGVGCIYANSVARGVMDGVVMDCKIKLILKIGVNLDSAAGHNI